ncbi:MAG: primosomal protein N' [Succinivibrio sp.]|nr:primosomal protein N' [Succinivibrio sp.]
MKDSDCTIVNVVINRPLQKKFAYKIEEKVGVECIGSRVEVNFAGSSCVGIITDVSPEISIPFSKIKKAKLLDKTSFISEDIKKVLEFGSAFYQYPLGQCYNVALPKMLRDGKPYSYENIPAIELQSVPDESALSKIRSQEQLKLIEILKTGTVRRKELRERGFSSQTENALIKKGIAKLINLQTEQKRFTDIELPILKETPPVPNIEQQNAILSITSTNEFGVFLLNGITGSGKTEVYLRVIEEVLKQGKAALVLVPEIALTPQTFNRFYRRFNVPVSSMHSALTDRERLDAYIDMQSGKSGILIGTRTALFTPIPNLGLIIIDEEHDSSFKQNDSFRYHARSLGIIRAKENNCPIILGSATPSLESVYNVKKGIYKKLDLTIRAGGASLPDFQVIDLRNEPLTEGLKTGVSETLEKEIGEETAKGNQVMLFLNRRGYAHHMVCHSCGHVFMCPHCDNLLTVHKGLNRLKCHMCENNIPIPQVCPNCQSDALFEQGFGTEQVSDYLKTRYPDIGIERIDRDVVTTKAQLESRLNRITSGKSQIVIGTQMLAKGHDFPNVTLVGILDIDSSLFSDDFRSLENAAQLLTQVSGRSGRGNKKGRVIIQTHHKDNLLINQLINPDCSYLNIAEELLKTRKNLMLPPYTYQAFLLSNSSERITAFSFLNKLHSLLISVLNKYSNIAITPVMSDKMEKQQNRYHFHMLVTCLSRKTLNMFLTEVRNIVSEQSLSQDLRFAIEVDPIIMC